jgi:dihydroorotate dehydrogenase electron transfer subunit
LKSKKVDCIYTVGPELMMNKVIEISDEFNVDCQISLERYMKCGFGICGSCCVDPIGIRMCVEGPCMHKEVAKKITEFGKYKRDGSGLKVNI